MVLQYIVANQVHARRPSSTSLWTHWGAAISIKRTVAAEPCRRKARKSNTNVRITTRVDWVPSKRRCRNVQWMSGRKLHEAAGLRCTSFLATVAAGARPHTVSPASNGFTKCRRRFLLSVFLCTLQLTVQRARCCVNLWQGAVNARR